MRAIRLHRTLIYVVMLLSFATLFSSFAFFTLTTFAADDLPDLIISHVSIEDELAVEEATTIYATLSNNSPISVTAVPVQLLSSAGVTLTEIVVSHIVEYGTVELELEWTPTITGLYTIALQIDAGNLITESDKINNRQEITVAVRGPGMTWYVDADIPVAGEGFSAETAFEEIDDALDIARSGDTVRVAPGIYRERLVIDEGVAVIGAGALSTTIENLDDFYTVRLDEDARFSGFTVVGNGSEESVGVYIGGDGATASDNRIQHFGNGLYITCDGFSHGCSETITVTHNLIDHNLYGIRVWEDGGSDTITTTITYNTIVDNELFGITLQETTSLLSYNIISGNGQVGIAHFSGEKAKLVKNSLWENTRDTFGVELDSGSLALDPHFQDYAAGEYRLSAGSPLRARVQGTAHDLGALPFVARGASVKTLTLGDATQFQRTLSWQPVAKTSGYWVYLGTSANLYSERFATTTATGFTFPFLFPGLTYFAAVTSLNATGDESELSPVLAFSLPGVAEGVFEEDSPLFVFDEQWQPQSDNRAAGGAYRASSTIEAQLDFTVMGDGFTLLRRVGPDGGRANLRVDGELWGSLEFYSPLEKWQAPATINGLGAGIHHVTLSIFDFNHANSSGNQVAIDQLVLPALHTSSAAQRQAIGRVNEFRLRAGLMPVRQVAAIDAGAQAHAEYLSINQDHPSVQGLGAHSEIATLPHFSGESPSDRARHYGYTGFAGEDVHFLGDPLDSVDGWMATVYHRNLVLCYGCTDAGYGVVDDEEPYEGHYDVLNMGSIVQSYPPARQIYTYPANRQNHVPTEWNGGEIPDPLPGLPRPVGYPISLYLAQPLDMKMAMETANSALTEPFYDPSFGYSSFGYSSFGEQAAQSANWQLQVAELTDAAGQPVDLYVLDQATDVPKYLAPDIVFLIAKRPLADNTTYYAHVAGVDSRSVPFDYRWSFATGEVVDAPDLARSSAAVTPMRPHAGERVAVSVVIRQNGPSAQQTRATIRLPSELTYVVGSAQLSQGTIHEGQPLLFELGILNGDATIRFEAQVANSVTEPMALRIPIELSWEGGQLQLTASTVVNGFPLYFPAIVDRPNEPSENELSK